MVGYLQELFSLDYCHQLLKYEKFCYKGTFITLINIAPGHTNLG